MPSEDMLAVEVSQLFLSNVGFVVLLKGEQDERSLPIFIGAAEAQSIAIFINGVDMPRPLTHDLLKHILDFMECRLMRIEICALKEGTFYARLVLDRDGVVMPMDCRPSDAIALALRCSAPIHVAGSVMEEAGRVIDEDDLPGGHVSEETPPSEDKKPTPSPEPAHEKSPLDKLKMQLERAVEQERYEDAARFRDEIRRLNNTHTEN